MFIKYIFKHLFVTYLIINTIKSQDDEETTTELTIRKCKEKNLLIGSNKSNLYDVTEVVINETIILECHYCNDKDEHEPKLWYKIDQINNTSHEVELDMHKDEKLNRISVSVDHYLTIHHSTVNDSGIYYCRGLQNEETTKLFNYIVDMSNNTYKKPEKGNLTNWKQYFDDYIHPVNLKLLHSNEADVFQLRNDLKTQLEVITDWETTYRPCEVCGRPMNEGIQEKFGFCRIKIENNNTNNINISGSESSQKLKYFLNLPKISCRSLLLEELFPNISNTTKQLNDFILVKKCNGTCNPDAEGVNRGWKFGSSKNFKYRRTIVLAEGEHLTLICPDSTLDNKIIWRRNGKVLSQGEPIINNDKDLDSIHIVVDAFNSLYLLHVTKEEEGNYTCQVDNIRMQQIRVFVHSKSRLLSEAFVRHMSYLVFILVMSCTCYCAGVIAACRRKDRFKKYQPVATDPV